MSVPASLLPELEEVVQHGSPEKRAETLRRVTNLFLDGAVNFKDEHVALFDDVMGYLIEEIEVKALAELARRLAPVPNAPYGVVTTLAKNDNIVVAGPVLKQARIDDPDLKHIAARKQRTAIERRKSSVAFTPLLPQVPDYTSRYRFLLSERTNRHTEALVHEGVGHYHGADSSVHPDVCFTRCDR